MRKTLLSLAFALLAFAFPAFGQGRRGGQERRQGGNDNRGHFERQPEHDNRGRGVERGQIDRRTERDFHRDNDRRGYHFGTNRGEVRSHWDGRRFDRDYFADHWGPRHPFYWRHCGWYGPRWGIGSYFWYDGLYFEVIDPIPPYWYDGQVVIVYDEVCDCYYAVNPVYPGVRIHIGVRF